MRTGVWQLVLGIVLFALPAEAESEPLRLVDVLRSANEMHPEMAVAEAGVEEAREGTRLARGAFDLEIWAEGGYAPVGKYEKPRAAAGLRQPTALSGIELWSRYENGADFPPYDGGVVTSEAGQASLGIVLPLLQGRAIDEGRLGKAVSELQLAVAEERRRQIRASVLADAAGAWWKWVVTGRKLEAYRQLLLQAEQRRRFLEQQVEVGALPRVELIDNQRLLSGRRANLAALELEFRKLSLLLGMYRRGAAKDPRPATPEELPALPPLGAPRAVDVETLEEALNDAPGVRIYGLSLDVVQRELSLAENRQLPKLDLEVFSSRSFGETRPYSALDRSVTETSVGSKLKFSWDVQRRTARGKAGILRTKRSALLAKKRLLQDQLLLSLRGQLASLEAQYEVAKLSREATSGAQEVSDAERQSFEMGQSSVLSVNLREQAVLSTYLDELDAIFELEMAWVRLQELIGSDSPADYLPPLGGGNEGNDEERK